MAKNPFQHIDLRVRNHDEAWKFYEKILPMIGFPKPQKGKTWSGFDGDGELPSQAWFGFTEDAGHVPNANRIAFWAPSKEDVDRLGPALKEAGARNVSGPRACPEYSPTYYAVFFEDPSGNRLEVCYRKD